MFKLKKFSVFLLIQFFVLCAAAHSETLSAGRDAVAGEQSFAAICASCHGALGKGDGAASAALEPKPRDLSDSEYLSLLTDEYLFNVITGGGAAVGKSPMMPAWGGVLGEEGTWNVIAYIREKICECEPAPQQPESDQTER